MFHVHFIKFYGQSKLLVIIGQRIISVTINFHYRIEFTEYSALYSPLTTSAGATKRTYKLTSVQLITGNSQCDPIAIFHKVSVWYQ